jgi:PKHD-type hydroxylase
VTLQIPDVLNPVQVTQFRSTLASSDWIDGAMTAGHLSHRVKHNRQLPETHELALRLGSMIMDVLERHPVFMSFTLPAKIVPPLFNAYRGGEHYGRHIDGAIRPVAGSAHRIRTDISATLFLSDPEEYDGGELIIEQATGEQRSFKPAAGTLLLYPSVSVHKIEPVIRGERLAAFFWVQSMVRDNHHRLTLFNLDNVIQQLRTRIPDDPSLVDLTGHYHNLLRLWADV